MKLTVQLFILMLGGSLGTILRYLVYLLADKHLNQSLPWGTLIVNLVGSFVIGFAWGFFERLSVPPAMRLFLFIGILGSFTTFSTFAFDNFNLLSQGNFLFFAYNILLNNVLGILLCFGGFYLSRFLS